MKRENEATQQNNRGGRDLLLAGVQIAGPALGIAFAFLCTVVFQVLLDVLVRRFAPSMASADWYPWTLRMLPMYLLAMPLSAVLFRLSPVFDPPPKRTMRASVWWALLAVSLALTGLGSVVGQLVRMLPWIASEESALQELGTTSPLWVNLLFVGILAPVMEELFYRKLVLDRLRPFGDLPAILLSGVAFGLIHGNFEQFFYATAVGCVFAYIYLNTGHIRYTVLLHMAINLIGGVLMPELSKLMEGAPDAGRGFLIAYVVFWGLVAAGAIASLVYLLKRHVCPLRRAKAPMTPREWLRVLLWNPAVWLLVFVAVLLFL